MKINEPKPFTPPWPSPFLTLAPFLVGAVIVLLLLRGRFDSDPFPEAGSAKVFRLSLFTEPFSLDPLSMGPTASHYLFNNIYRGLLSYDPEWGEDPLRPEDAQFCRWEQQLTSPPQLFCQLRADLRWSTGEPLTAEDYVRGFRRLVRPESRTPHAEQLLALKNARAILAGEEPVEALGVEALSATELLFSFAEEDQDFLYRLSHPALSPLSPAGHPETSQAQLLSSNGPYQVEEWSLRKGIRLSPNPHYHRGNPSRPDVEILFVEDDHTARRLYDHGRLNFLRRLVTSDIPQSRQRPDFHQVPLARFDYIGFGPQLKDHPQLRQALAQALNYPQLKDLYQALGLPGCPGLPSSYMAQIPCHSHSPSEALKALALAQEAAQGQGGLPSLELHFSQLGGDDVAKGMEWMQNQWKRHLQLEVELRPVEQGMFVQSLRHHPPPLFRRGVPLDRPTCLSALEIFHSEHRENLIGLKSAHYDSLISQLAREQQPEGRQELCSQALSYLIHGHWLIPLGEIHFSMLVDRNFTGWKINELNQLDLKDLVFRKAL